MAEEARGAMLLEEGRRLLRDQKFGEAAIAYRAALQAQPGHGEASFGLGVSLYRSGERAEGLRFMVSGALSDRNPEWAGLVAQAWSDGAFGLAARSLLTHLIATHPGHAACAMWQEWLANVERTVRAHYVDRYKQEPPPSTPLNPKKPVIIARGKVVPYDKAITLSASLLNAQKTGEGIDLLRRIIQQVPNGHSAYANLAVALKRQRDYDGALLANMNALWVAPTFTNSLSNVGNLLVEMGSAKSALVFLQAAVLIAPDHGNGWLNLATAYHLQGGYTWEAEQAALRALELMPNEPKCLNNLANVRKAQGLLADAVDLYRRCLEKVPDDAMTFSNLLLALQYADGFTAEEIAADHLRFGEVFEPRYAKQRARGWTNARDPEKRLKVGFVSPDLRNHACAYFIEPLWEHLDRERIEIHAYYGVMTEDTVSARLKSMCHTWNNVARLTDEQLAEKVRADGIDILIDATGHTGRNRLLTFAAKPAPVQATWLGHPNTTGLKSIDWRITDALADPPGVEPYYAERLWRLPHMFGVYRPLIRFPEKRNSEEYAVKPTPALANGHVTFGSCNNLAKITPAVIELWCRLLREEPTSKLLIEAPGLQQPDYAEEYRQRFVAHGIAPERIRLVGRDDRFQYLRYNEIDIALDPFPCNGGTTNCDLLWMGVPLVSWPGAGFVSRMGLTFGTAAGFPEWMVGSADEYVARARQLASDVAALNRLRLSVRPRMEAGPLRDEAKFGRDFGDALRAMWREYCDAGTMAAAQGR